MKATRLDKDDIDLDFLKQEFNRFKSELSSMKDRMSSNTTQVLDQMGSYLNGDAISSRISALESDIEYYASKLKDSGKDAVTRIESEVGNRPIASIAVAFGLGLLAAQLIRRS